ncbi:transferrin-binding protein-like solute binding protein [Aquicoccus sp. G2-2]|uniref:transferrin-binding protein-like solute binding protein n=1 Tax=Aquicoccus sp. G2-2 TaxID=3092120 RepID=UPI002AE09CAC|nr:transferrin-binding protein-like solute binding protein [Aquicoccus sp. G2-2]MEA1112693.1 transferrin-binding protein-like solute binding protein [Aquicoccus sp. G2-2]
MENGTTGDDSSTDTETNSIPETLSHNLQAATYSATGSTLTIEMSSLDAGPRVASYGRTPALDVGPYQAYTYQQDGQQRHFTALVAQTTGTGDSVTAGVVSDGGQFNRFFAGGFYQRTGNYTPAAASGLVSYSGTYAGVTNLNGTAATLKPVTDPSLPAGDYPNSSARTSGAIFLNVDFTNNAVNGSITNHALIDQGIALPDVVLVDGNINSTTGTFYGSTEYNDADQTANGNFGGIFGGTDAKSIGGVVHMDTFDGPNDDLGMKNEKEYGTFVLTRP